MTVTLTTATLTTANRPTATGMIKTRLTAPAVLVAALALAGCVTVQPARLALPAGLDASAPLTIDGIGPGQRGQARLGDLNARFERGASRLDLFERLQFDRAAVSYTIDGDGSRAACKLRGESVTRGLLQLPLRNAQFDCEILRGDGSALAKLEMGGTIHPGQRRGMLVVGGQAIEVQSLHKVAGSPLPLDAPAGYVFTHQGRAVGALEVTTPKPRLWRAGGPALDDAIARAALALALLWDPGQG